MSGGQAERFVLAKIPQREACPRQLAWTQPRQKIGLVLEGIHSAQQMEAAGGRLTDSSIVAGGQEVGPPASRV